MDRVDSVQKEPSKQARFLETPPLKFALMSFCTLGLYDLYWSYRNWTFVKHRKGSSLWPWARALFYPLWHYSLITELERELPLPNLSGKAYRLFLGIGLLFTTALWRLPDPYWLTSMLGFVFFLPALVPKAETVSRPVIASDRSSFRPANLAAYVIGSPLTAFVVLSSIGFFPSALVIEGDKLWLRDIDYLRQEQILGENEQIQLFYSEGLFSIAEGGQFVSKDYVTSYSLDSDTDETLINFAAYPDIERIETVWSDNVLDFTIVTIYLQDGAQFDLWLPTDEGGDRKFVEKMNENWKAGRVII